MEDLSGTPNVMPLTGRRRATHDGTKRRRRLALRFNGWFGVILSEYQLCDHSHRSDDVSDQARPILC